MALTREDLLAISELIDGKLANQKAEIFTYMENVSKKEIALISEGLDNLRSKVDRLDEKVEIVMEQRDSFNAINVLLKYHQDKIKEHEVEIEKIKKLLNVS